MTFRYKIFIDRIPYTGGRKGLNHVVRVKELLLIQFRHMERFGAETMK